MDIWQIDFVAVFFIGLLSSFGHCIGMCGGFVMTYSLKIHQADAGKKRPFWQTLIPHFLYNSGRLLTYVLLGLFFGLIGETLKVMLEIRHIQGAVEVFAGVVMILMGFDLGGWLPRSTGDYFPGYHAFKRGLQHLFQKVNRRNVFQLGLILGFVPCGLVYAAGAKAAASGSALGGMLTMFIFGLGTVPALMLVGVGAHLISLQRRQQFFRLATLLVIVLGFITVYRGIHALSGQRPMPHHQHSQVRPTAAQASLLKGNEKRIVFNENYSIFKTLKSQKLI
ncbi:MAG: sulfite exporter TauE/SafE family protein [Calditrichaeota bacterium]|nr:sulfite exporter TauE/SafE family protein [Calditrichota bacterium]